MQVFTTHQQSCGMVMFLHLSVILFTVRLCYDVTCCLAADSHVTSAGGCLHLERGLGLHSEGRERQTFWN